MRLVNTSSQLVTYEPVSSNVFPNASSAAVKRDGGANDKGADGTRAAGKRDPGIIEPGEWAASGLKLTHSIHLLCNEYNRINWVIMKYAKREATRTKLHEIERPPRAAV